MKRRDFLRKIAAAAVYAVLPTSPSFAEEAKHDKLPNFIIVFTDDQGYNDLGCFGSENIRTPNIDRMAGEGIKFTSFYARLCKNLALISECYSGIFITDRIVWNNIKKLDDKKKILMDFMKEFEKHDKESEVLSRIPVYLIKKDDIKFYGCCNAAVNFFD